MYCFFLERTRKGGIFSLGEDSIYSSYSIYSFYKFLLLL